MNVHLDYDSGQSYSQPFNNFQMKVSGGGTKRVKISFREKGDSRAYASFSLPCLYRQRQTLRSVLTESAMYDGTI